MKFKYCREYVYVQSIIPIVFRVGESQIILRSMLIVYEHAQRLFLL